MRNSTAAQLNPNVLVEQRALASARRAIKQLADEYRRADTAHPPFSAEQTTEALDRIGELLSSDYTEEKRQMLRDGFRFGIATTLIVTGFLALTAGLCALKIDETTSSIA